MKVLVAQKGAREHFLAARALHRKGLLSGLATDWYAFGSAKAESSKTGCYNKLQRLISGFSVSVIQYFGSRGRAALAARAEEIPDELIRSFPIRSLWWKWKLRRAASRGRIYEGYAETDAAFAKAVAALKFAEHDVFFGFSYASLELLQAEAQRNVFTVLDQIDPGPVEFRLVAEEMARHPELAGPAPEFPGPFFERNRQEWRLANLILVNSEWSRDAIVAEGADPAKIEILPLAYEVNAEKLKPETLKTGCTSLQPSPKSGEGALRVLWLGQVNVRKGIHYLIEAARLLEREKVRFDVVGPIDILPAAVQSAPKNMRFHGPVSRDRAAEWYRQSEVFVLPTLSDGFALTQLEAFAHGLPVITTPNCGRVVEDGKTGFIIPPRDARALAEAIQTFASNRNLSVCAASACREALAAYSVDSYGKRLVELVEKRRGELILQNGERRAEMGTT